MSEPVRDLAEFTAPDRGRVIQPRMIFPVRYGLSQMYETDPEDLRQTLGARRVDTSLLVTNPADCFEHRAAQ
jgi:hypothetical protein